MLKEEKETSETKSSLVPFYTLQTQRSKAWNRAKGGISLETMKKMTKA